MAASVVDSVAAYIDQHALLDEGTTVLVAASGGCDSMACLSILRRLGYDVHALHANYGLREGADADEALVRRWCQTQTPPVPLAVVSLDAEARAEAKKESLQEAARRLRYDALAAHAGEIDATAVATGHHRDDQAETLLLNLVRGSGPEGVAGMRPSRSLREAPSISLVRPLLGLGKEDIEAYANAVDLPWRSDPTNRSHKAAYAACEHGGRLSLDVLADAPPVWRRRLLLAALRRTLPAASYSYAMAEELDALVDAQVGTRVEVSGGTVWRERGDLRFLPEEAETGGLSPTPVDWGEPVAVPQGELRVERCGEPPSSLDSGTPNVVYADADRLGASLTVRAWADGDRVRPLGLAGSKTVSDLLTDAQVAPHRRRGICVLCTDEHVAWVVGHRLDHRVRVRPDTERIARLILQPREKPSDDCQSS